MTIPSNTNPVPDNKLVNFNAETVKKVSPAKKEGALEGRKVSHNDKPDANDKFAHGVIAESNTKQMTPSSPEKKSMKATKSIDPAGGLAAPIDKKLKEHISILAYQIEEEWIKSNGGWDGKTKETPNYAQFFGEEILYDAIGEFLVSNRSDLKENEKITDFLQSFAVTVKQQNQETVIRVARRLIEQDNPATSHFLFLCKDTPAFEHIVKNYLTSEFATEFVCLYASDPYAKDAMIIVMREKKETIPYFFCSIFDISYDEDEFLSIGRAVGASDQFQGYADAMESNLDPHLITHFFKFPTERNTHEISELLKYKLPITSEMLSGCITTRNYPGLEVLLPVCKKQLIVDAAEDIFYNLIIYRDNTLGEIIVRHAPYLLNWITFEYLEDAAKDGNVWFFEWLLKNGLRLTADDAKDLLSLAVESGNLPLIKFIFNTLLDDGHSTLQKYPEDLQMQAIIKPEERKEWLLHVSLFSPLDEVYALVARVPEWADTLETTVDLLPLQVRFPHLQFSQGAGYSGISREEYESGSMEYAEKNRLLIDRLLNMLVGPEPDKKIVPRETLLVEITKDRFARFPKKSDMDDKKPYLELRKDDEQLLFTHETPVYLTSQRFRMAKVPEIITVSPLRYSWCLKHLNDLYFDNKTNTLTALPDTSMEIVEYVDVNDDYMNQVRFHYTYAEKDGTETTVPMTFQAPKKMIHTATTTLIKIQDHLQTLHEELVSFKLDFANPESLKQFYEKVARGYWLIATLCETSRGTPHNAMIWLNLMYDHHKLPPPIPKIEHFFLDNTMLVIPVEKAIESWESYFEPTLDVALENKYGRASGLMLAKLLAKNGNLLRMCSPKTRDNDILVARAVATTPSANQYASKRLQKH